VWKIQDSLILPSDMRSINSPAADDDDNDAKQIVRDKSNN